MSSKKALIGGIILSAYSRWEGKAILWEDNQVIGVVDIADIPEDYQQIAVPGSYISPGFIDLQIYGIGENLFSADMESLALINKQILQSGTTSYLLCLATNTLELFKQAIQKVQQQPQEGLLGLHLEGPFLNAKKRGAHPEELIIKAEADLITDLLADAQGQVKMMTIAPELVEPEVLTLLQSYGLILSAGHSDASFDEATDAFNKGVQTCTHLFNAMSSLHHREVGLPGAVSCHPRACASIIVDGIHVSFEAVKIAKQLMGERLFLITDAVASCQQGIYQHVRRQDHYVLPDGTLSGSALTLLEAVANTVLAVGVPLEEAIRMATLYPARILGRNDIGQFTPGAQANIVCFDEDFKLQKVFFQGQELATN